MRRRSVCTVSRNPPVVFALPLESAFAHAPTAALLLDDEETRHIIIRRKKEERRGNDNDNGINKPIHYEDEDKQNDLYIRMLGCIISTIFRICVNLKPNSIVANSTEDKAPSESFHTGQINQLSLGIHLQKIISDDSISRQRRKMSTFGVAHHPPHARQATHFGQLH